MTCGCIVSTEICLSPDCRNTNRQSNCKPEANLTPAQLYLHSTNGIASQEWQDGYNMAARHYAGWKG